MWCEAPIVRTGVLVELVDHVNVSSRFAAFVAQPMPHTARHDYHYRSEYPKAHDPSRAARRRIITPIPKRQLDVTTDANEMVGLLGMRVPVGHRAGVELYPIDLPHGDSDCRPVDAKDLRHEAAARDDVAEFVDPNAIDVGSAH